ncbi:MAG: hypothetical protein PVH88_19895 [Ignavibacteria bacterium]|jgi:hypothetical protein
MKRLFYPLTLSILLVSAFINLSAQDFRPRDLAHTYSIEENDIERAEYHYS